MHGVGHLGTERLADPERGRAGGAASMLATRGVAGISAGIGVTGVSVAEPLADAQGGMLGCCC